MKQKMVYVLVIMLVFSTTLGAMASAGKLSQSKTESTDDRDFSHTILGEFGTATTCVPCKYAHAALKEIYKHKEEWGYPFYYITLVRNKNNHAYIRTGELGLFSEPTVFWDGGFREDQGGVDKEWCMGKYNQSLIACGDRDVADIDISVDVDWLGAVNRVPEDGATDVLIYPALIWNNSAMNIDVTVDNNEASTYNGHIHVYVTEINSSYWIDKFHLPYTYAFLDYAWNEDIEISAGGSWQDSVEWDGCDHDNGFDEDDEDYILFDTLGQDNTMLVTSVFDGDTKWSDETLGTRAGIATQPHTFDIYFGNTTNPPKVKSNQTQLSYYPGDVPFNSTWYWKVVSWDQNGYKVDTPVYSFTTRDNHPPNVPSNPNPPDNSSSVPINQNFSWSGGDPDGDNVTYDVYLDTEFPPGLVSRNQTETYFHPSKLLKFSTNYYWKIVAWERFGLSSNSTNWTFTTEDNKAPRTPFNPIPPDGEDNVAVQTNLSWKAGDPNRGDIVTYDLYFEEGNPDPGYFATIGPYDAEQIDIIYDLPDDLEILKTYYWKIVATDRLEETTEGPVWSFDTGENFPPDAPTITGEKEGTVGEDYEFTFSADDPEEDPVDYYVDWGDGYNTGWVGPYESGEGVKLSHNWSVKSKYNIKAKARDQYGQEGQETIFRITIPKNKQWIFSPFIGFLYELMQRFPWLEKLLSFFPVFNTIFDI